jgi:hypothetical protein
MDEKPRFRGKLDSAFCGVISLYFCLYKAFGPLVFKTGDPNHWWLLAIVPAWIAASTFEDVVIYCVQLVAYSIRKKSS